MRFITAWSLTLLLSTSALAEGEIKTHKVTNTMHMLESPQGGNVLVSGGEDGVFIVDDQLEGQSEAIKAAIKKVSGKEVKFILNTHYHFDHTGGNEHFGSGGAIIMAHDNVRQRLSTKQFISFFKREMAPLAKAGLPVVTFDDSVTLHYNGDAIRMIHVPGAHTDGDAIVHFPHSNVIAAGDLIFNGLYPFIDTEHGGSITGVIAGVESMLKLANDSTVIVPGHGQLMNRAELRAYGDMMKNIAQTIEQAIAAGKSREEVIAAKPTASYHAGLAEAVVSADAFVGVVYDDLKK